LKLPGGGFRSGKSRKPHSDYDSQSRNGKDDTVFRRVFREFGEAWSTSIQLPATDNCGAKFQVPEFTLHVDHA